jgi:hypothetical protein
MMPACNKHKAFQMAHTNEMTAHIWAQQEKGSGRSNNGNLSFEGPVLYSYTTPIARFTTDAKGRPAVLITSHTYSKTTSCKHMPALWRAIDYGRGRFSPAFRVPRLGQSQFGGAHALNLNDDHKPNLAYLIAQYHETVAKASRARTYYQAGLLDYLEKLAARAVDYAKAFKLKAPKFAPEADFAKVEALRAARDAKNATPAAIAKRARAVAAREALAEHKAALARLEGAEKLAAWRRGEPVSLGYFGESRDAQGGALLRVKGDNLETSLGAKVPLAHAVKVFRFAKLCRERGEQWHRNGSTLRVGHFQVDAVAADGSFRAGCHKINWPEIEQSAVAAGVADMAGADTRDLIEAA